MVEGARLESVYSPKGYRGFESHPLNEKPVSLLETGFFYDFCGWFMLVFGLSCRYHAAFFCLTTYRQPVHF